MTCHVELIYYTICLYKAKHLVIEHGIIPVKS